MWDGLGVVGENLGHLCRSNSGCAVASDGYICVQSESSTRVDAVGAMQDA
jgi:hypothetical protein